MIDWTQANADAGLLTLDLGGERAIVWGVAPLDWQTGPPATTGRDATYHVAGYINDVRVIDKEITYEEAVGLDTVIGFSFKDALGFKYAFGVLFASKGIK